MKILTDTGWMVKETIKGLPEAGKKVGGAIGKGIGTVMKAPFKLVKTISDKSNASLKVKSDTARKARDMVRTQAIKSALKAGDYTYFEGDEKLVPGVPMKK